VTNVAELHAFVIAFYALHMANDALNNNRRADLEDPKKPSIKSLHIDKSTKDTSSLGIYHGKDLNILFSGY